MSIRLRFALLAIASLLLLQFAAAQSDHSVCSENCRFVVVPSLGPAGSPGDEGPTGPQGPQGETGPQGLPGINGTNGTNGVDGLDGKDGINGTNGTNGVDGLDGKDGINGTNGVDGLDGKDGINGTNGAWNASATYIGGTLISPTIVTPTISAAVLNLQNPGGTTSLSLDHYEYLKTRSLSAMGYGGLSLGNFPITLVRVGRMVTMFIGSLDSPNPGAHGTHIYVTVSQAQFPTRFRPPGNPLYSIPVISNGIHTLGSVRVESSGTMTFWAGAPNTPFQQEPYPVHAGWSDTAISWVVGFDN